MRSILLLCALPFINAHLILNEPFIWGISDGNSLEQPLEMTTQNWVCAGKPKEENGIVTLEAGKSYQYSTTCGEKDLNADGCLIGDFHSTDNVDDFSGCALGISYGDYTDMNDWKYIAYTQDCAKRGELNTFKIVENVESVEKAICSWHWTPSINYASPQTYMNCFYCKIIGNGNKNELRQMDFMNVPGAQYSEKVYNDVIKSSDIYGKSTASSSTTTKTSTKTEDSSETTQAPKSTSTTKTRVPETTTKCWDTRKTGRKTGRKSGYRHRKWNGW